VVLLGQYRTATPLALETALHRHFDGCRLEGEWFALPAAHAKAQDPERRRRIGEARRGKPCPPHVVEAMRRGRLGKPHSEEARRKMSAAQRRRGAWPPAAGEPWTDDEDELLRTLPAAEVLRRTGRTLAAVYCRRRELELPDGRTRNGRRPG
jgi:hypothetical protein